MRALCVAVLLATLASGQSITPAEREKAISYLKRTEATLFESVAGLSEAQWNFKPARERWSIAESAEHIAITTQADLRSHYLPHFVLKDRDSYQWMLFIAPHCDRHFQQLNEVKADVGYPK